MGIPSIMVRCHATRCIWCELEEKDGITMFIVYDDESHNMWFVIVHDKYLYYRTIFLLLYQWPSRGITSIFIIGTRDRVHPSSTESSADFISIRKSACLPGLELFGIGLWVFLCSRVSCLPGDRDTDYYGVHVLSKWAHDTRFCMLFKRRPIGHMYDRKISSSKI